MQIHKPTYLNFVVFAIIFLINQAQGQAFDHMVRTIIFTENKTDYIAFQTNEFKTTDQSYNQGNISTTGITKQRILIYNLNTGHQVAAKSFGTRDSKSAIYLLGYSPGNLWIYSKKYKSGLQSLHPFDLSINTTQATIYASLNTSIGRFLDPTWNEIEDYYSFDPIQQKIIITNTDTVHYYIDAQTFATQPITEKIKLGNINANNKSLQVIYNNKPLSFEGFNYLNIKWGTNTYETPSFLMGQFLLNTNKKQKFDAYYSMLETIALKTNTSQPDTLTTYLNTKKNMDALIRGFKSDEMLLAGPDSSFFVLEKSAEAGNAVIKINRLTINRQGLKRNWEIAIAGMFYNIYQARDSKDFKTYFGDFMPNSTQSDFYMINNKLIVIYLNQVCCIDTQSGKILWRFQLT